MPPSSTNGFFGIKVSKTGINVNNASDTQLTYKDDFSTKTYYDNTKARMLEGLLPDGNYGLWVSSPGIDVRTAVSTTPGQLIFNSSQQTFKVMQNGSLTLPDITLVNNQNQNNGVVIAHNLGYVPIFFAYAQIQVLVNSGGVNTVVNSYYPLPLSLANGYITNSGSARLNLWLVYAAADTTNFYITQAATATSSGAGNVGTLSIIYYIVQPTF